MADVLSGRYNDKNPPLDHAPQIGHLGSGCRGAMDRSPDRVDALVWAMTELAFEEQDEERIVVYEDRVRISPL